MHCQLDFLHSSSHPDSTYVDFHQHNCFELVYYISGNGYMNLNGMHLEYLPHTMTLTRPNLNHDERHVTRTEVLFIGFTYDDFPVTLSNGLFFDDRGRTILQQLEEMKSEITSKKRHYTHKLDNMVRDIIIDLDRMVGAEGITKEADPIFYARRFIEENFNLKINLHELALLSGYSYHHFRHLFKFHAGLSPMNYIIRKRLDHAELQLRQTNEKISTIALESGFSTTSQFISIFKQSYGCTPFDYRKKCR